MKKALTEKFWGGRNAPIVPKCLRDSWQEELLPEYIRKIAGLPQGVTFGDMGTDCSARLTAVNLRRLQHLITSIFASRLDELKELHAFPKGVDLPSPSDIEISGRTFGALMKSGILEHWDSVAEMKLSDLAALPGVGPRSLLELLCTVEANLPDSPSASGGVLNEQLELPLPDIEPLLARLAEHVESDWAEFVCEEDARFSGVLPRGTGTFAERVESVLETRDYELASALCDAARALERRADAIRQLHLEEQLDQVLHALLSVSAANHDALKARFGWNGSAPVTLAEAGEMVGITRERIRQLEAKACRRIPQQGMFVPGLALALATVAKAAPVAESRVPSLLLEAEISQSAFSAVSLLMAAGLLKQNSDLTLEDGSGGHRYVLSASQGGVSPKEIASIAKRMAGGAGAVSVTDLADRISSQKSAVTRQLVESVLRETPAARFLDDEWAWFPDAPIVRSRLRTLSRRVLSIFSPIRITRLREGIRREVMYLNNVKHGWPIRVPPRPVLRRYFEEHREFAIDDRDMVSSIEPIDYRNELTGVDKVLVDVLKATPTGVLDRSSLREEVSRRGVNLATFEQAMTYSAVVERLDTNVWTARGFQASSSTVRACKEANAKRAPERRVFGFGWTVEGKAWFAARIPPGYSAVIGVPAELRRFLVDQKFQSVHGSGTITVNKDGTSFGYGTFLRSLGAEADDPMVVEFDLAAMTVQIRLGEPESEE